MEKEEGRILGYLMFRELLIDPPDFRPEMFQFGAGPKDMSERSPVHLAPPATI